MHALKDEAFIVRHAVPADVPALDATIAKVDEETEFLAKPGEYMRRWAPGFAERLAAMNEKNDGAYVIAEAGGEIVGFLGAYAGVIERRCNSLKIFIPSIWTPIWSKLVWRYKHNHNLIVTQNLHLKMVKRHKAKKVSGRWCWLPMTSVTWWLKGHKSNPWTPIKPCVWLMLSK